MLCCSYLVSTPEQTRILMFDWKMCLVDAGSKISQQTFTPTSTMVRRREIRTLAAGLVQAGCEPGAEKILEILLVFVTTAE